MDDKSIMTSSSVSVRRIFSPDLFTSSTPLPSVLPSIPCSGILDMVQIKSSMFKISCFTVPKLFLKLNAQQITEAITLLLPAYYGHHNNNNDINNNNINNSDLTFATAAHTSDFTPLATLATFASIQTEPATRQIQEDVTYMKQLTGMLSVVKYWLYLRWCYLIDDRQLLEHTITSVENVHGESNYRLSVNVKRRIRRGLQAISICLCDIELLRKILMCKRLTFSTLTLLCEWQIDRHHLHQVVDYLNTDRGKSSSSCLISYRELTDVMKRIPSSTTVQGKEAEVTTNGRSENDKQQQITDHGAQQLEPLVDVGEAANNQTSSSHTASTIPGSIDVSIADESSAATDITQQRTVNVCNEHRAEKEVVGSSDSERARHGDVAVSSRSEAAHNHCDNQMERSEQEEIETPADDDDGGSNDMADEMEHNDDVKTEYSSDQMDHSEQQTEIVADGDDDGSNDIGDEAESSSSGDENETQGASIHRDDVKTVLRKRAKTRPRVPIKLKQAVRKGKQPKRKRVDATTVIDEETEEAATESDSNSESAATTTDSITGIEELSCMSFRLMITNLSTCEKCSSQHSLFCSHHTRLRSQVLEELQDWTEQQKAAEVQKYRQLAAQHHRKSNLLYMRLLREYGDRIQFAAPFQPAHLHDFHNTIAHWTEETHEDHGFLFYHHDYLLNHSHNLKRLPVFAPHSASRPDHFNPSSSLSAGVPLTSTSTTSSASSSNRAVSTREMLGESTSTTSSDQAVPTSSESNLNAASSYPDAKHDARKYWTFAPDFAADPIRHGNSAHMRQLYRIFTSGDKHKSSLPVELLLKYGCVIVVIVQSEGTVVLFPSSGANESVYMIQTAPEQAGMMSVSGKYCSLKHGCRLLASSSGGTIASDMVEMIDSHLDQTSVSANAIRHIASLSDCKGVDPDVSSALLRKACSRFTHNGTAAAAALQCSPHYGCPDHLALSCDQQFIFHVVPNSVLSPPSIIALPASNKEQCNELVKLIHKSVVSSEVQCSILVPPSRPASSFALEPLPKGKSIPLDRVIQSHLHGRSSKTTTTVYLQDITMNRSEDQQRLDDLLSQQLGPSIVHGDLLRYKTSSCSQSALFSCSAVYQSSRRHQQVLSMVEHAYVNQSASFGQWHFLPSHLKLNNGVSHADQLELQIKKAIKAAAETAPYMSADEEVWDVKAMYNEMNRACDLNVTSDRLPIADKRRDPKCPTLERDLYGRSVDLSYAECSPASVEQLLKTLCQKVPDAYKLTRPGSSFVDVGCAYGKVVLHAAMQSKSLQCVGIEAYRGMRNTMYQVLLRMLQTKPSFHEPLSRIEFITGDILNHMDLFLKHSHFFSFDPRWNKDHSVAVIAYTLSYLPRSCPFQVYVSFHELDKINPDLMIVPNMSPISVVTREAAEQFSGRMYVVNRDETERQHRVEIFQTSDDRRGLGVRAIKTIQAGEIIGEIDAQYIAFEKWMKLTEFEKKSLWPYIIDHDSAPFSFLYLLNWPRYINSCFDPQLRSSDFGRSRANIEICAGSNQSDRLCVKAVRSIDVGEELMFYYENWLERDGETPWKAFESKWGL